MTTAASDAGLILVIDDDAAMRRACEAALRRAGYHIETYSDGPSGLARIREQSPSVLIVDLKMPGMGGLEVIKHVKEIDFNIVIVVITGFATVDMAVEAMKSGAYDFIPKPFTAEELRVIISRAVERERLGREAQRLRDEKAAQARKFVTFVTHQLKSPLGAVRQYLDVLLHQMGDDAPERQRQWIERSSKKITEMLEIITNWLTISKVEGGQFATDRSPLQWRDIVDPTLEGFLTEAQQRDVTLQASLPDDLPRIVGDEAALRMLFSNLVSNAIKYNRDGGRVDVTAEADEDIVRLSVKDDGIGIAPEYASQVFDDFFRVKDGSTRGVSGTGMGLAICKKIANELGGDLLLVSEPGQGSTFTVVLPRAQADDDADTSSNSDSDKGVK